MFVLIPHPNQELLLVNQQKKLISLLHENGAFFYAEPRLWLELPDLNSSASESSLQKFKITGVKFTELFQNQDNNIYLSATVIINDKKYLLALPFLHYLSGEKNINQLLKTKGSQDFLPMNLKIFRTGIKETFTNRSFALTDAKWTKLK